MNLKFNKNEKLFFTADTHYFHKHVIDYCNRPFEDIPSGMTPYYNSFEKGDNSRLEKMHDTLIKNWNTKVPKNGIVFIVGDFAFTGSIEKIKKLLEQLNGFKYLILGNHCYRNKFDRQSIRDLFTGTYDILDVKVEDDEIDDGFQWLNLCHYPIEAWSKKSKGSWMIHGHIHSGPLSTASDANITFYPNRYDVGVDNNNFTPISYQELKTIIAKQNLKSK